MVHKNCNSGYCPLLIFSCPEYNTMIAYFQLYLIVGPQQLLSTLKLIKKRQIFATVWIFVELEG